MTLENLKSRRKLLCNYKKLTAVTILNREKLMHTYFAAFNIYEESILRS